MSVSHRFSSSGRKEEPKTNQQLLESVALEQLRVQMQLQHLRTTRFGVGSPLDGLQSVRNQPPEECGSVTRSESHVKVRRARRDKLVRDAKPLRHKVTAGEKLQ